MKWIHEAANYTFDNLKVQQDQAKKLLDGRPFEDWIFQKIRDNLDKSEEKIENFFKAASLCGDNINSLVAKLDSRLAKIEEEFRVVANLRSHNLKRDNLTQAQADVCRIAANTADLWAEDLDYLQEVMEVGGVVMGVLEGQCEPANNVLGFVLQKLSPRGFPLLPTPQLPLPSELASTSASSNRF